MGRARWQHSTPGRAPRPRWRATYHRHGGVRHFFAADTPTNSSWLNRIETQFTALRYLPLDGTDHASHKQQGSMIRRYIIWRNRHTNDQQLRGLVDKANVA